MIFQKKLDDSMQKLHKSSDSYREEVEHQEESEHMEETESGEEERFKTLEQYQEENEINRVKLDGKDWFALFLSAYATIFLTGIVIFGIMIGIVWLLLLR